MKVGICGFGTVGSGTLNVLSRNQRDIAARAGGPIEVTRIASRTPPAPEVDLHGAVFSTDVATVLDAPDVDVVVETIGGTGIAREVVLGAIERGKHVVTANKALIAEHGAEIFEAAEQAGVTVAYEAAVAGGIPVIKAMREGLVANRIQWLAGIINGTGNFILTEMAEKQREFADVLKEAQALGYAEADPTFDVEGIDAAHKLTILASTAFGVPLQFASAYTEGISRITPQDFVYAHELGYRIKHLGIARRLENGFELRVHPTLVPETHLIANVNGVMNAVLVEGDAVGQTLYYGAGAGSEATASAVIADLVDIARSKRQDARVGVPHLGYHSAHISEVPVVPIDEVESAYYLRLLAEDRPGVLARVATVLSDHGINIESIMQKESELENGHIPMIMLTHRVRESAINHALQAIEALPDIHGEVFRIRVEVF
ncbi:homoserine dehydrogenase [Hahella sp. SMD15-11]|uniref:Homoserine dehydrogenase n=1 Tax=Thermohahella caldifontis TaxID=3142973 RepID=A0AB39V0K7_9GAMM